MSSRIAKKKSAPDLFERGSTEHYLDAQLYDHEYSRRRNDVRAYLRVAQEIPGSILELGCGTGRILLPLARTGRHITGVDSSPTMLERCREKLVRVDPHGRRSHLILADFCKLSIGQKFPLILCPFNAFMHLYTLSAIESFLGVVRSHLAPGGRFVLDVLNPDLRWLARDPTRRFDRTRFVHPRTGRKMIYQTQVAYDPATQIAWMKIHYSSSLTARSKVVRLTQRYFFPAELRMILHYNGFHVLRHEGGFDGDALGPHSEEQFLMCVEKSVHAVGKKTIVRKKN